MVRIPKEDYLDTDLMGMCVMFHDFIKERKDKKNPKG